MGQWSFRGVILVLLALLALLLGGCGGGGGGGSGDSPSNTTPTPTPAASTPTWQPSPSAVPATGNYIYFKSDAGHFVGQGQEYLYTPANAAFSVVVTGRTAQVTVEGATFWSGEFALPLGASQLAPGAYLDLRETGAAGSLQWRGDNRACGTASGWFVVDKVTYIRGTLMALELRFEHHCDRGEPALRGKIRWAAQDDSFVWGPLDAQYSAWQAPAGSTPAQGNYLLLQSVLGEYIGQGVRWLYTPLNAITTLTTEGATLKVRVRSSSEWTGEFRLPIAGTQLQPGFYDRLSDARIWPANAGGVSWMGNGRACEQTGWVIVDRVSYLGTALNSLDMRFEATCGTVFGGGWPLRGQIHWSADDQRQAPGPVQPPPADLWRPSAALLPATGNAAYFESDSGDFIGQGLTQQYGAGNSRISFRMDQRLFVLAVEGDTTWLVEFQPMESIPRLEPGYYAGLMAWPVFNPTRGALVASRGNRGCNTATGWMVVDAVQYVGDELVAVELRFEHHCEGVTPALRGWVRWVR